MTVWDIPPPMDGLETCNRNFYIARKRWLFHFDSLTICSLTRALGCGTNNCDLKTSHPRSLRREVQSHHPPKYELRAILLDFPRSSHGRIIKWT